MLHITHKLCKWIAYKQNSRYLQYVYLCNYLAIKFNDRYEINRDYGINIGKFF